MKGWIDRLLTLAALFAVAGLIVLLVSFAWSEVILLGSTLGVLALLCLLIVAILSRRISTSIGDPYCGVRIVYTRETRHVWSSHICGKELLAIRKAVARSVRSVLEKKRLCKPRPEREKRFQLFDNKTDREYINKLSLEAFASMLDQLADKEGAVIISASALNFPDRQPQRLQDRINAVGQRPGWVCEKVLRTHTKFETIIGRWMMTWPIREGEMGQAIVPGIVVWRRQDAKPQFEPLSLASGEVQTYVAPQTHVACTVE